MILVTGGAGYIGSHTCVELLNENYDVVVIDNLCNSSSESILRINELTGKSIKFYEGDIADETLLKRIFEENEITVCIHFAGLKSVSESVQKPMDYYKNNITGTLTLLKVLAEQNIKNFIFSSSATVYGEPAEIPITEECPRGFCTNPYGWTKFMIEQMLMDLYIADKNWNIVILRYFSPIGAHKSGCIGEDPKGIPNNLMPYITQVAIGKIKELNIYGNDYNTPDGTGIRDYIHVVDLARGHVRAIQKIEQNCGLNIFNLGTGRGYSVLEVVKTFEEATGIKIPYTFKPRRNGDIAVSYCNPMKAEKLLGWKAHYNLKDMCEDAWRWQLHNPNGYNTND